MSYKPDFAHLPEYYKGYVLSLGNLELFEALVQSGKETQSLLLSLAEDQGEYRYQPQKWSIKELIAHVLDAERIFAYRALRFARNDKTNLPGFDENTYTPESNAHARTLIQLAGELERVRATTLDLFHSFTPDMMARKGTANNVGVSVLNLGFIIAGHETHHRKVLIERYLKNSHG